MYQDKLKQLEEKLYSQISLIGKGLRQGAARALAWNGSPDAIRMLAQAIARSDDRQVLAIALDALCQIREQRCVDEVCAVWAVTRHKDLANLLVKKGWVASAPADVKVLSALKAGHLNVVTQSGAEIVEPLLKAFSDADSEIASRASQCAIALSNPDAVDYLCERWSKTRDRLLEQLILQGKYVARKPIEARVLSALKLERLEVITKAGKEVIEPLIKALSDKDREIAHRAERCIAALKNPDAVDYFCERWLQSRNKQLEQAIVQQGYVARKPIEVRVLSALKAGQPTIVIEGGTEIVEPLCNALSDADPEIISRAKQCANNLINPDAIDYLCEKWANTRNRLLEQVVLQGNYLARQPVGVRVLCALKTGQGQTITCNEAQIITFLLQACKDADPKIATKAIAMLGTLRHQVAIDALCSEWAKTRAKHLMEALQQGQYVAASPTEVRVLSALKVGKLEAVINGGIEVAELLLQACKDADPEIAKAGQLALRKLKNSEAQEFLCNLAIEQDHQLARTVVVVSQYTPRDPNQQALFYFLTEQWDKYESLDFENTLLQTAYQVGDEQLRKQIMQKARQVGRVELVRIIAGGQQGQRIGEMANAEWETVLAVLKRARKWEEMWQLAQVAPAVWSARLLQQLKESQWIPPDSESRTGFSQLSALAARCIGDMPALDRLVDCQKILTGHTSWVNCLAINPDGNILVSGSSDNTLKLWSLPDGELIATLCGHSEPVGHLAITPDGRTLVSGSKLVWLDNSGRRVIVTSDSYVHRPVEAWSPTKEGTIRLWNLPDGKSHKALTGHIGGVSCFVISPDGRILVSGGGELDKTVRLWSLPDGQLLNTLSEHTEQITCLAISPDGHLLVSGSRDHTVKLWSLGDFQQISYQLSWSNEDIPFWQKRISFQSPLNCTHSSFGE